MGSRPIVVIGVGNPMRSDDGVGRRVADDLRSVLVERHDVDVVELDGESARLVEAWRDADRAIVIDAACSGALPGSVHRLVVGIDDLPPWAAGHSTHGAGVAEAIALSQVLEVLPNDMVVYGVECGDLSMGEELSPQVAVAAAGLVEHISGELS